MFRWEEGERGRRNGGKGGRGELLRLNLGVYTRVSILKRTDYPYTNNQSKIFGKTNSRVMGHPDARNG